MRVCVGVMCEPPILAALSKIRVPVMFGPPFPARRLTTFGLTRPIVRLRSMAVSVMRGFTLAISILTESVAKKCGFKPVDR